MHLQKTRKSAYKRASNRKASAFLFGLSLALSSAVVGATDVPLPPVNLGSTSFQDGIAFPGWLVEETIEYNHAGQINNHLGDKIPGTNTFSAMSATTHVAYISNTRVLGGFYGAEILLPVADVDLATSFGPNSRNRGVGDLIVSPLILQWTDHKLFGVPYFHRFVVSVVVPTGSYRQDQPVNAGNNLVSLNPYYAFTVMPTEKVEFSARIHYLWNSENTKPFVGSGADSVQPGQAYHANFAASYEVSKGVRVGINGYYLNQLTEDKVNGQSQTNSKERVLGIGPGMELSGHGLSFYLNGYFESEARNRPEGYKVVFRLSKVF
jgi:hypothetical protein